MHLNNNCDVQASTAKGALQWAERCVKTADYDMALFSVTFVTGQVSITIYLKQP